ncbi:helix-turn-helix domain-containing protein [Novosphingobium sp. FKTRR1]|uniref:helix-turn-helix domain-containing protein n=1 Tax=Novosphingobium sp. FKTRR1 TaxID=2879118 RepID=UPI001CF0760A|nr:helix-turn-helix domain-containing protein [Novosphingobium sp. FKTRR1]
MSTPPTTPTPPIALGDNIFALPGIKKPRKAGKEKWSDAIMARGYSTLPSILFWGQGRLDLAPDEFNVLLQLISHWWTADQDPHPAKKTIAARMGKSERMVQRHLTSLENKGFIRREKRFKLHQGQDSNGYVLDGLLAKLEEIAPEFAKTADQNKRRRAKVEAKQA